MGTEAEILAAWHERQLAAGGEYAARWEGVTAEEMLAGELPAGEEHFEEQQYKAGAITFAELVHPELLTIEPAPAPAPAPVPALVPFAATDGYVVPGGVPRGDVILLSTVIPSLITEDVDYTGIPLYILDIIRALLPLLRGVPGWGRVLSLLMAGGIAGQKIFSLLGGGIAMPDGGTSIVPAQGGNFFLDGVLLQGPGVKEPHPSLIAKSWTIRFDSKQGDFKVQYWRLVNGKVVSHNQRTGIYHAWMPKKHLVLSAKPRITQLMKGIKLINKLTVKTDRKLKSQKRRLRTPV